MIKIPSLLILNHSLSEFNLKYTLQIEDEKICVYFFYMWSSMIIMFLPS